MHKCQNRRNFIITSACGLSVMAITQPAYAQSKVVKAFSNFFKENYGDVLDDVSKYAYGKIVEKVSPAIIKLNNAVPALRNHVIDTWSDGLEDWFHTEKCPYCISLAREVERLAPELDEVRDRTPRCFLINGARYLSSSSGSLRRFDNDYIGPVVGYIWFNEGNYYGVTKSGSRFKAQPEC